MIAKVKLKSGREKSLKREHPWIFSGAVSDVEGTPKSGETVKVISHSGEELALGAFSPLSQIRVRVWSFNPTQKIDRQFFKERIEKAINLRNRNSSGITTIRLVFGEADGVPGLIVDRYGEYLVCQFLSAGSERWREEIVEELVSQTNCRGIFERSDVNVREKEGLELRVGVLYGEVPPANLEIEESGIRFIVDIYDGHKTGFYLDQRDSRRTVEALSANKDVLNCFSYTGGFAVAALKGGARKVINIDSSSKCLELARANVELNGFKLDRFENIEGDVFSVLRTFRDSRKSFDVVILDPPKFVESFNQLEKSARGYKDVNLLAFKLLRPGGLLITFSCSGLVSPEFFQKIVSDALCDSGREAIILRELSQPLDHPINIKFPESRYLKGLVCEVTD